jgi:hypothetical protein
VKRKVVFHCGCVLFVFGEDEQDRDQAGDRIAGRTIAESRRLVMRPSFGFNACKPAIFF